jgi:glutamyl-tRNA reductase
MIMGEPQILGQVRRAFSAARATASTGPVLNRLMQLSLAAGRRVRRETGLSRHAPSVPRAALALSQRVLGSVSGRRVLVVGAGKIAGLVVEAFSRAGARIDAVANRTLERAHALAAEAGAVALPLDAIATVAETVDIIVACTGASRPVITRRMLEPAGARRTVLALDLSVPRGIEPAAADLQGVRLYTLDDLTAEGFLPAISQESLARAERLVEDTVIRFERWLASRAATPLITALRNRAESIVETEMTRAKSRLQGLDERQQEVVRAVVDSAVRKLLHDPMVCLRESAARRDAQMLEAATELFGLRAGPPTPGGDT